MLDASPEGSSDAINDTEPAAPSVVRDFRAMCVLLSEADNTASSMRDPNLAQIARSNQLSLLTDVVLFVERTPEIGGYYHRLGAYVTNLGMESDALEDDDRLYECKMFSELFESQDEPVTDTTEIYINGQLLTDNEALIVLFEILEAAEGPLLGPQVRERGLHQYIRASSPVKIGGKFNVLKTTLEKRLSQLGLGERLISEGKTSKTTLLLDLRELEITKTTDPAITAKMNKEQIAAQEASPTVTIQPVSMNANDVAAISTVVTPEVPKDDPPAAEQETPVANDINVLTIRGERQQFTQLERSIIDAVLEGNTGVRDIVSYLQNGDPHAEQDYYHKIMQSLHRLTELRFGDTTLLTRVTQVIAGQPRQAYQLPPNARIETNKRDGRVLRFTDSSSSQGEPGSKKRLSNAAPLVLSADTIHERSPAKEDTVQRQGSTGTTATLTGLELVISDGRTFSLEPQQKRILAALAGGGRQTISELVTAMHGNSDATVNDVVSKELVALQSKLGAQAIRRKQGKGGRQPARWWIDTAVIDITI